MILNDYFVYKCDVWYVKQQVVCNDFDFKVMLLKVIVCVFGCSGVCEIWICDFQVISDSLFDFVGYNFGFVLLELQFGVFGSCFMYIMLIQVVEWGLKIDVIEVEVIGD